MSDEPLDVGVEVKLFNPSDFLKIKETLTRIGVASRKEKTLYQSVCILHKKNRYFLVSFKEMFILDGKQSTLTEEDIGRRNTICDLLQEWGLLEVVRKHEIEKPRAPLSLIKVISFADKKNWKLVEKYSIGKRKQ